MPAAETSGRSAASENFHRLWPWLAYALGWLLISTCYQEAGAIVFLLGMLRHWRFWRWALPLGLIALCFGYWRGTRKAAERRSTCPSS